MKLIISLKKLIKSLNSNRHIFLPIFFQLLKSLSMVLNAVTVDANCVRTRKFWLYFGLIVGHNLPDCNWPVLDCLSDFYQFCSRKHLYKWNVSRWEALPSFQWTPTLIQKGQIFVKFTELLLHLVVKTTADTLHYLSQRSQCFSLCDKHTL